MQGDCRIPALVVSRQDEGPGKRAARLQAEARQAATLHTEELAIAIARVARLASEVSAGGDVYPAGVRGLARRISDDAEANGRTLEALLSRRP